MSIADINIYYIFLYAIGIEVILNKRDPLECFAAAPVTNFAAEYVICTLLVLIVPKCVHIFLNPYNNELKSLLIQFAVFPSLLIRM